MQQQSYCMHMVPPRGAWNCGNPGMGFLLVISDLEADGIREAGRGVNPHDSILLCSTLPSRRGFHRHLRVQVSLPDIFGRSVETRAFLVECRPWGMLRCCRRRVAQAYHPDEDLQSKVTLRTVQRRCSPSHAWKFQRGSSSTKLLIIAQACLRNKREHVQSLNHVSDMVRIHVG